jgi:GDP-mannose 6-dehydrogenase
MSRKIIGESNWVKEMDTDRMTRIFTDAGQTIDVVDSPAIYEFAARPGERADAYSLAASFAQQAFGYIYETNLGKVGFANEIGRMAKHLGVDGARVMDVVCRDERLNISRYYMRPGNPFGGSCLPKDVNALSGLARIEGVNLPLLDHVMESNHAHFDMLLDQIARKDVRRVGLLGLAFKADTDDMRGSAMVAIAETLLGRGYQLRIFDPSINLTRLIGANEAEIQRRMPHLAQLLCDSAEEVVRESDVIIASQKCVEVESLRSVAGAGKQVIDVNGWPELKALPWSYEGICW